MAVKRKVKLNKQLLLNPERFPKMRFVSNDKYSSDYNLPTDTVSINTNNKYSGDVTYLSVLGLMESTINPKRSIRPMNSSMLFNNQSPSRDQSYEYFSERINCNIATLVMLYYLTKADGSNKKRLDYIYSIIRGAYRQCIQSNGNAPIINMLGIYKMCLYFIHSDGEGKNKARLGAIYNRIYRKLQKDFFNDWLTK